MNNLCTKNGPDRMVPRYLQYTYLVEILGFMPKYPKVPTQVDEMLEIKGLMAIFSLIHSQIHEIWGLKLNWCYSVLYQKWVTSDDVQWYLQYSFMVEIKGFYQFTQKYVRKAIKFGNYSPTHIKMNEPGFAVSLISTCITLSA